MIYRVGEHEINAYEQNRLKSAQTSSNGEKFNLNQYTQPDATQTEDKETAGEGAQVSLSSGNSERRRDGVVVQLSGQAAGSKAQEDKNASSFQAFSFQDIRALWEKLQHFAGRLVGILRQTFYRIWNDPPVEEAETQETDVPVRERLTEEYKREKNLPDDYEQMINTVTENGTKTLARNSTLLTYYDRNGRLTQINASDKERILHGDRNTKKL